MKYSKGEQVRELDMTFALDESDMSRGSLRIQWGSHQLDTAFTIAVPSPTFYRESSQ